MITETKISLIDMVMKGSLPIMIALGLLLLATIYIVAERLIVLSKANKNCQRLLHHLKT
ncbi:MAG: hypothetical protein IPJ60_13025 [Sphingobacteriaceae bacterium]|nr:hypothetical protein [Sphingobacteriaceae bacterium]